VGSVKKTANVPYTAEQMYALVNDIESYPEFLTWCTDAKVYNRKDDSLTATVSLATGKIKQTFTTENMMQAGRRIDVKLISGPFNYLNGYWKFQNTADNYCHIELKMEFEFKNKVLKFALNAVFNKFMNSLVGSFSKRARKVYGQVQHD
jgi:ribosome-associated toxin RatA of RatAB toxin-antitoxin module